MNLIDFILNIAGLLLWLNWRAIHLTQIDRPGATLVGTLRNATPPRSRWLYFWVLVALLFIRGFMYYQIAPALPWHPKLPLGPATLTFRSDIAFHFFGGIFSFLNTLFPIYMLLYSFLSFGITLGTFYLCLIALSCLNGNLPENDPYQRFVQLHLGVLEIFPWFVRIITPFLGVLLFWYCLTPILLKFQMMHKVSFMHELGQGILISLAFYSQLGYLIIGILGVYVLNTYIYFGDFTLLNFIQATGNNLLRPLRQRWLPMTFGKVDLAAPIAIVIVVEASVWLGWIATKGYGLASFFQKLSY